MSWTYFEKPDWCQLINHFASHYVNFKCPILCNLTIQQQQELYAVSIQIDCHSNSFTPSPSIVSTSSDVQTAEAQATVTSVQPPNLSTQKYLLYFLVLTHNTPLFYRVESSKFKGDTCYSTCTVVACKAYLFYCQLYSLVSFLVLLPSIRTQLILEFGSSSSNPCTLCLNTTSVPHTGDAGFKTMELSIHWNLYSQCRRIRFDISGVV